MEKLSYFIRRFLLVIPTFLGITLLCFALIQFVPGGPVEQIVQQMKGIGAAESGRGVGVTSSISEEQRKAIEAHFGFDKPFYLRYWKWLVTDRLGMRMESYKFPNKTAWQLIKERFKVSLIFGVTGFVLSYLVCIPLGILKALRHDKAFAPDILIGGMIEVPGAALMAAEFAKRLDFLSIGTNDLIQYTLAIDRVDDEVNYLYDPLHPAVLKLIKMVIDAGQAAGIPVAMCGEMAGDSRYTRLLLGMGLSEFSMHHTALQEVKRVINNCKLASLVPQVRTLLDDTDAEQIPAFIDSLNSDLF